MVDVDQCYEVLELEPGASWEQVKQAYRDLAYVWHPDRYPDDRPLLKQKAEDKLKAINVAYERLSSHIRTTASSDPQEEFRASSPSSSTQHSQSNRQTAQESRWDPGYLHQARLGHESAIRTLIAVELAGQGIKSQVSFHLGALRVCVDGSRHGEPDSVARILTTLLNQLRIRHIQRARLSGTLATGEEVWSRQLLIPALPRYREPAWLSFEHLEINSLAYPGALVLAALLSQLGLWSLGLPQTWIHDLVHLVLAWLASRLFGAGPDPGFLAPSRSFWVYGLTLACLGRWGVLAWRGRWAWHLGVAGALISIQFWLTFLLSDADYALIMAWSGVGGEVILGALLMAGFQIRLPFWIHWRAWRYLALVVGACLYWQGFERWHGLGPYWGLDWPEVLAGRAFPTQDMERLLVGFGWSPYQIIQSLAHLSEICGVVLIGIYVFGISRSREMQRWPLWRWQKLLQQFRIR